MPCSELLRKVSANTERKEKEIRIFENLPTGDSPVLFLHDWSWSRGSVMLEVVRLGFEELAFP